MLRNLLKAIFGGSNEDVVVTGPGRVSVRRSRKVTVATGKGSRARVSVRGSRDVTIITGNGNVENDG